MITIKLCISYICLTFFLTHGVWQDTEKYIYTKYLSKFCTILLLNFPSNTNHIPEFVLLHYIIYILYFSSQNIQLSLKFCNFVTISLDGLLAFQVTLEDLSLQYMGLVSLFYKSMINIKPSEIKNVPIQYKINYADRCGNSKIS